ncbi:MAG: sensor histidine kinase [Polyangiaceae bacterium]
MSGAAESAHFERFIAPGNVLATVCVTAAGFMGALFSPETRDQRVVIPVAALCVVHALLGTVGLYWLERHPTRRRVIVHFVVAFFVLTAALWLSRAACGIASFSLVSQGVLYLRRRGAVLIGVGTLTALFGGMALRDLPMADIGRGLAGWLAGAAFVVVFSAMTLRQHRARREVERLAGQLAAANERLREYARDIEELVSAKERNRIAREIHDTVGHCLTVVVVQLQAAEAAFERDPARSRKAVETARTQAHEGLAEVRRSVAMLRGSERSPVRPIEHSLRKLVDDAGGDDLQIELKIEGRPRQLAEPVEHTLYRAAQESLTNVRKHASARSVMIELDYRRAETVVMTVEDDGRGSPSREIQPSGWGLVGVRERAELVGGAVSFRPSERGGFALELEVPG